MLFGIVTDIHEEVESLRKALAEFQTRRVNQVISLGDACDCFSAAASRAAEVAAHLQAAGAVGVWGNHDFGVCYEVSDKIRSATDSATLNFFAGMRPFLSSNDCRFSHVEPWLDPHKVEDLWYFEALPETPQQLARTFEAVPERFLFIGHFHRWWISTPTQRLPWNGEDPIALSTAERFLVVVAPVVSGWCATFETETGLLTPIRCGV